MYKMLGRRKSTYRCGGEGLGTPATRLSRKLVDVILLNSMTRVGEVGGGHGALYLWGDSPWGETLPPPPCPTSSNP
jgi:hypothetical protein